MTLSAPPLSASRLTDLVTGLDTITAQTRRAVCAALDKARGRGEARPTPRDCQQAAQECGANSAATLAAWGHIADRESGEWIDCLQRTRKIGTLDDAESVLCIIAFASQFDAELPSFFYSRALP